MDKLNLIAQSLEEKNRWKRISWFFMYLLTINLEENRWSLKQVLDEYTHVCQEYVFYIYKYI